MTLTKLIAGYLIASFIAALIVLLVGSRLHRLSEHQKRNRQGGTEGLRDIGPGAFTFQHENGDTDV